MSDSDAVVAMTTLPSADKAAELARRLVEEGLVACVNLIGGVRSIYRWKGEVSDDAEVLCVLKTRRGRIAAVKARLLALHPYEVPELVVLDVIDGHAPYLQWVAESTS